MDSYIQKQGFYTLRNVYRTNCFLKMGGNPLREAPKSDMPKKATKRSKIAK